MHSAFPLPQASAPPREFDIYGGKSMQPINLVHLLSVESETSALQ